MKKNFFEQMLGVLLLESQLTEEKEGFHKHV